MNRRTESYWEKRSIQRISAAEKSSIPYIRQVQNIYKNAAKDTIESVRAMYRAYYKNDNTFDMDALNSVAPQGDVKRFLAQMKAKGLSTYLPDNFKGRMTRLELINAQIWGEVKKASVSEKIATTDLYEKVFENSYYQTGFDMAKGLGENIAFSTLDKRTVEKVLNQKFEGEDFSQRIWSNTDKLASQLSEIIARSIATGASVERTSREFRERFGVGISNATRLVRTETCYFENNAELAAYAEMGIEEFVFVATLDERTSDICQSMDGQRFKMSKAMVGENVPPLHPNCRSTIVAYLGKEYEPETRAYRDPKTGRSRNVEMMNFNEWKAIHEEELSPEGRKTDWALVNKSLAQAEKQIRNKKYETLLVYGEDNKVLHAEKGGEHRVMLSNKASRLLNDKTSISHNHPSGSSFSAADLKTASAHNLNKVRAVSKHFTFEASAKDKWPKASDIDRVHGRNLNYARSQVKAWKDKTGKKVSELMWGEVTDAAMRRTADELGINYKSVRINKKKRL